MGPVVLAVIVVVAIAVWYWGRSRSPDQSGCACAVQALAVLLGVSLVFLAWLWLSCFMVASGYEACVADRQPVGLAMLLLGVALILGALLMRSRHGPSDQGGPQAGDE
jgi:hypothetical protein